MKRPQQTTLFAILILVIALGLRLFRLGSESLWIDEGFSLRDTYGLDLMGETRPLYFLFMTVWMKLGMGHSEFFLRLPAALFGAASVWLVYLLGRKLVGERPALMASFFMAISVLQINHSREIRMYSLSVLVTLLSTYCLTLALEHKRAVYIIGYAIFALAGLLTSALTVLVMLAHGLFLLLYLKKYRPISYYLIGTQLAIVGTWIPWLHNNVQATASYGDGYTSILDKPTPRGIVEFFGKFFIWKWSDPGKLLIIASLLFSFIVFALVLYSLKSYRRDDSGLTLIWLWMAVPMSGMIVASYTMSNVWMIHYLIAISPAVFLLVAKGILSINNRHIAFAAVFIVAVVTLGRLSLYMKKHIRPEWRSAVSYIQAHESPGDVIGVYYGGNQYVFRYYYRGKSKWSPLDEDQTTAERFSAWNNHKAAELIDSSPNCGKRFWLVLSNHNYAGGPIIVDYVQKHYRILDHKYYSQVEMLLFDSSGKTIPNRRS